MLKVGAIEDLDTILNFAKEFHKVSPYKDITFDNTKVSNFIEYLILDPLSLVLLLTEEAITVGCLLATTEEVLFGKDLMASELMYWVEPTHRGKDSWSLVDAYQYWSKKVNCTLCSLSTLEGPIVNSLDIKYKQIGFNPSEHTYLKVL